ncbi:uncharacterized protein [Lolium perenne]|uniref:uncharacterized protein n=1 Tax=Lolium perenne TaxID=4522 RepID=UPI0021EA469C|nr:uncharacterized protein LOC127323244 [Lolium perenne]
MLFSTTNALHNKPHTAATKAKETQKRKLDPTQLLGVLNHHISLHQSSMGVQSNEGAVMFSSIALLQQRFRELERVKEKREVRLLQILTTREADLLPHALGVGSNDLAVAAPGEQPVRWLFHPELLYPCRPLRGTAALFPLVPATTTASECKTIQLRGDSLAGDLWPSKAYTQASSEVDVDTSLHL